MPTLKRAKAASETDPSWSAHLGMTWTLAPACVHDLPHRHPAIALRISWTGSSTSIWAAAFPFSATRTWIRSGPCFFEYGLHARHPDLYGSTASAYANFLKDLIAENIVSDTLVQMENVDKARIMGAELDLEWFFHPQWVALRQPGLCAYGRNTSADEYLPSIPPVNGLRRPPVRCGAKGSGPALKPSGAAAQNEGAARQ